MSKREFQLTELDKEVFLVTVIIGLFTHLYALTNKLPAIDDLSCVNSYGAGSGLGRWFLDVLGLIKHKVFGNYSAPAWNGVVAILLIAIGSVLLCRILEIKSRIAAVLVGAIMVSFPAVTSYMLYAYTSYYYCLGLVLVLYGVYIEKEKQTWKSFLASSFILSMGIGIYQAFLPLAATVFLVILFMDVVRAKYDAGQIIKKGIVFLVSIMSCLVIYYVANVLIQKALGVIPGDYKGAERFGSVILEKKFGLFCYIYETLFALLKGNFYGITSKPWLCVLLGGLYVLVAVIWVIQCIRLFRQKRSDLAFLLIIIGFLLPIAIHSLFIMVEAQYFYTLMLYSDAMLFIIPIALIELPEVQKGIKRQLCLVSRWFVYITAILSCLLFSIQASGVYLEMDMSLRATESYYTTVITQIKSLDDYNPEYPVVFVGNSVDSTLYDLEEAYFKPVSVGGARGTKETVRGVFLDLFLEQYCGYTQKVELNGENVDDKILSAMPCYPKPGSIAVVEDRIVVKFSE